MGKIFLRLISRLKCELGQAVAYLDHFRTASISLLETVSTCLKANAPTQDDNYEIHDFINNKSLPNLQDLSLLANRSGDMLDTVYQGHASLTAQLQLQRRDAVLKTQTINRLSKENKAATRASPFGERFLFSLQSVADAKAEHTKSSENANGICHDIWPQSSTP